MKRFLMIAAALLVTSAFTVNGAEACAKPCVIPKPKPKCVKVPEPSTMMLLGTGLFGLGAAVIRKRDQE